MVNQEATEGNTVRRSKDLVRLGILDEQEIAEIDEVCKNFALAITPEMINLINPEDKLDPIAKQFVPTKEELIILQEELADPIGDDVFTPVKGITHRYPDRLLLKPVHVCPVYCRFCFRREKVGPGEEMLSPQELKLALEYISSKEKVWEVILSGGDPLILPEKRISEIIRALDAIPHVEIIRIHTRVPVVDPKRITTGLLKSLKVNTPVYIVLHCNHQQELTQAATAACAALIDSGIPMLSQTVLLKGVNDNPETMTNLIRALLKARIKPYYLHHGDFAKGTGHFRTTIEEGQRIMKSLRGNVSGIAQPTYVLDIPGGKGKVPIGPNYLSKDSENSNYIVEDYQGYQHIYPPTE